MAVLLALGAAVVVGTSDFLGGFASRHTKALIASAAAHGVGALFFAVAAPLVGGSMTRADLAWSLASGVAGAIGIMSLYRGIGTSRVSIVSPMAGVGAAAVPVLYSTARGEDLTSMAAAGIALGLVAIALVSRTTSTHGGSVRLALLYGAGAGLGLGTLLMALGQTGDDAGLWPLLPSRLAGLTVLATIIVLSGQKLSVPRPARPTAFGAGFLAASGNALFLAGTQIGSLSTVAVITAMFPAMTVLWARLIFRERLNPAQLVGLVVALCSVGLIAGSG